MRSRRRRVLPTCSGGRDPRCRSAAAQTKRPPDHFRQPTWTTPTPLLVTASVFVEARRRRPGLSRRALNGSSSIRERKLIIVQLRERAQRWGRQGLADRVHGEQGSSDGVYWVYCHFWTNARRFPLTWGGGATVSKCGVLGVETGRISTHGSSRQLLNVHEARILRTLALIVSRGSASVHGVHTLKL